MNGDLYSDRRKLVANLQNALERFRAGQLEAASRLLYVPPWRQAMVRHGHLYYACRYLRQVVTAAELDEFWKANVPGDFRRLDPALYPSPASLAAALAINRACDCGENGVIVAGFRGGVLLSGPTGSGKTRAAFALLRAWLEDDPYVRFKYVSAPALKRQLSDAARGGRSHQVLDELLGDGSDILFIDDLSQARFTPAFAELLFELIDRICRDHISLVVTVQTSSAELVRKWCADDRDLIDTAEAIARRLRDYTVKVRFAKPRTAKEPA